MKALVLIALGALLGYAVGSYKRPGLQGFVDCAAGTSPLEAARTQLPKGWKL